jgi:uncharacterized protein
MEIVGFALALFIGLTLGLIGGGGSILTVPILIYIFNIDAVLATAYSLFIVGITSLVGSVSHIRQGNVDYNATLAFGIPSVAAVFLTRLYLLPLIPNTLCVINDFVVTKRVGLLCLFAVLMLLAAQSMLKKPRPVEENANGKMVILHNYQLIFVQGLFEGMVTGLVGAGGGFLIITTLVVLAKLPMKKAIGTSLIIIAMKSLMGFKGDLAHTPNIDWHFLLIFSSIAIVGILIGSYYSKKISNDKLKPAFGYFVLIMGIYILTKELFFKS